ncbi:MAG TPA: 50S ribosomal protein L3 [Myxococcales bacterium]|nr:50S ribosomal protein L3 [Myxococcales bacterium]
MPHSILGRKLGVTQMWGPEGNRISATAIQVGPCVVTQLKSEDGIDGYNAVQIGFEVVAERKLTKPEAGVFKKLGLDTHRHLREFRVTSEELATYEVGQVITTENLKTGNFVDVSGTSKGSGFSGVMKRHNYHGAKASHGVHESYRGAGTGGQGSATPARVPKGMKRPGQHGNKKATTQNLMVTSVDHDNKLIFLQGSVPGPPGGLIQISEATKTRDF